MKKLITFLFLLTITFIASSQTTYYIKQKEFKMHQFHGTQSCFDSVMIEMNFDPNISIFTDPTATFNNVQYNPGEIIAKSISEAKPRWYGTWTDFYNEMTTTEKDQYKPYPNNVNSYSTTSALSSGLAGKANSFTGSSSQFIKGDGTYGSIITNLSGFTNGPGYITGITGPMVVTALGNTPLYTEVDGSTTNEIELPSQAGNSGKVLTTNGTSPSWATVVLPNNTNLSGSAISITKQVFGTVTPTTGNGYSINISGAGLTNLVAYSIIPVKNTSTATSVPKIAVKSESTSAIVVNIIEGNNNTVNILGSIVLLGTSEQFVDVTGLTLRVILYGN